MKWTKNPWTKFDRFIYLLSSFEVQNLWNNDKNWRWFEKKKHVKIVVLMNVPSVSVFQPQFDSGLSHGTSCRPGWVFCASSKSHGLRYIPPSDPQASLWMQILDDWVEYAIDNTNTIMAKIILKFMNLNDSVILVKLPYTRTFVPYLSCRIITKELVILVFSMIAQFFYNDVQVFTFNLRLPDNILCMFW